MNCLLILFFLFLLNCSGEEKDDEGEADPGAKQEEELLDNPYGSRANIEVEAASHGEDIGCLNLGTVKCQVANETYDPPPEELKQKPLVIKKVSHFRELWFYNGASEYVNFSLKKIKNEINEDVEPKIILYNPLPLAPKFYSNSFVEFFSIAPVFGAGSKAETKAGFAIGVSPFFKEEQNNNESNLPFLLPPLRYEFLGEIKNLFSGLFIEECQKVADFYTAQQKAEALKTIIMPALLSMTLCTCDNLKKIYQDGRFETVDAQRICSVLQSSAVAQSTPIIPPEAPGFSNSMTGEAQRAMSISFWRPMPYPGYVCLGDVASNGLSPVPETEDDHIQGEENRRKAYNSKPEIGNFASYCVRKEFTKETNLQALLTAEHLIINKGNVLKGDFNKDVYNLVYKDASDFFKGNYQLLYVKEREPTAEQKISILDKNFIHFIE